LEQTGFKFNNYDPCIANCKINGAIQSVKFHVDDLKSSQNDPKVNDYFIPSLNVKYGKHGEVKATRGKVHDYFGMTFTYGEDGVALDMRNYIKTIFEEFSIDLGDGLASSLATDDIFVIGIQESWTSNEQRNFILLSRRDYLPVPGRIFTWLLPLYACETAK
jgi:hypothetical protein